MKKLRLKYPVLDEFDTLRRAGLTTTQMCVLFLLVCEVPGLTLIQIANIMGARGNYYRPTLRKFEHMGLIRLEDRKHCLHAFPTERGQQVADTLQGKEAA